MVAINVIKGLTKPKQGFMSACKACVDKTVASAGFRFDIRHVPAHQGKVNRRAAVNEWCDEAAKAMMRRQRAGLTDGDIPSQNKRRQPAIRS